MKDVTAQIRVMVVDDSAVVRELLQQILKKQPDMRVVGAAPDPVIALTRMQKEWPDVLVLDVEMPRMDGITFLRRIMKERPTPTVICSSLTDDGMKTTLEALSAGAVSVIAKPSSNVRAFIESNAHELLSAIRAAAAANPRLLIPAAVPPRLSADAILAAPTPGKSVAGCSTDRFIALGISTGGTQALEHLLPRVPETAMGAVIVQHMPELFTHTFAKRLNEISTVEVKEAESGDRVLPGRVLIAPGGKHTVVKRAGSHYTVDVVEGPAVSRHCPSVDVLFRSVAKAAGANAIGVIMTGMGDDGVRGMREMHDAGAHTIAQDERSCVVYGMPREAVKAGVIDEVLPLSAMASVFSRTSSPRPQRASLQERKRT